ncbi:MAG: hypothetical protein GXX78_03315 [Bacteroidales bacterium]|nr:hypothetical protein [Bacteroidales bacterium]
MKLKNNKKHKDQANGYSIHKICLWIFFIALVVSPFLADAQLSLTGSVTTPITCNGGTATVTVTVSLGTPDYEYSSDGTTYSSPTSDVTHDFTGISAGNGIQFWVRDSGGDIATCNVDVSQPNELTFSLAGQSWSCASCNGSITVTVNGGTAPYDITGGITGTDESSPYEVTGLCAGDYTVSVSDANGCAATNNTETFSIVADALPTGCTLPLNRRYDLPSYPSSGIEAIALDPVFTSYSYDGNSTGTSNNDSMTYRIPALNFSNIQVRISASQSGGSNTWDANDFLEISYTTDNSNPPTTVWTPFFTDRCRWEADPVVSCDPNQNTTLTQSAWIDLAPVAGHEFYLMIRVKSSASDKDYTINAFDVRGRSIYSALNSSETGTPSGCVDAQLVTYSYVDQAIQWHCYNPVEFSFYRNWTVNHACGSFVLGAQRISVGTNPTLADPRDTIFDFCHNESVTISFPASSDDCDADLQIDYVVRAQGQSAVVVSGTTHPSTDPSPIITFPRPVANDTVYVITWTATDDAGFSTTQDQRVTIRRPITASISPNQDFCSGQNVSFTITRGGGTGSYVDLVPGDALGGSVSIVPNGTISGNTFTTSNLTTANPNIQVIITDRNVDGAGGVIGGCPSSTFTFDGTGGDYHVHENITTNPLQRD